MPRSTRGVLAATATASVTALVGVLAPSAGAVTYRADEDAATAAATPRIVGGGRVPVTTAPWQVRLTTNEGFLCGGALIDPNFILTAAHCTFGSSNAALPPSALQVETGTSGGSGQAGDAPQQRGVIDIRRHPYYSHPGTEAAPSEFAGDVAVLRLSSPVDVSGPATRPVPVAYGPPPFGTQATVSGYGVQDEDTRARDGFLYRVGTAIADPSGAGPANAVTLLARSRDGSSCFGDSGGPLVASGGRLVGLVSVGFRCGADTADIYSNLGTPEIRRFLEGDPSPPRAPRGGEDPELEASASTLRPGSRVRCDEGTWSGSPRFAYAFRDGTDGRLVSSGTSSSYTLRTTDVGTRFSCQAAATNAGGTGVSLPTSAAAVARSAPRPSLRLTASRTSPRRGDKLRYTATIRSRTSADAEDVRICTRLSSRYRVTARGFGGRISDGTLCWTLDELEGGESTRRGFTVRIDRDTSRSALVQRIEARTPGVYTAKARRTIRPR